MIKAQQVKQVATGFGHTVFLQQDGYVWACGDNGYGHLGIGNEDHQISPCKVPLDDVKHVMAETSCTGGSSTFFLKTDGSVWACGENRNGQLGVADTNDQVNPVKVPLDNVKHVVVGDFCTFFLKKTDGSVWACGDNRNGQLGMSNKNDCVNLQPIPKYHQLQVILQQLQEKNDETQDQINQASKRPKLI